MAPSADAAFSGLALGLRWAGLACGAFTAAFFVFAGAVGARRLRAARRVPPSVPLPPVTIIKPLKGAEGALEENLASFCRLDYPCFQLIFCLQNPDDPALAVATRLRKKYPQADIEVVVSKNRLGINPKVNNMANAYAFAKYDLILLSDADVRVTPDFLRRMTAPFAEPGTGLTTAFYEAVGARGLWGRLEALSVNAGFLPQALAAATFGMRFAMGAAMMVRRSAFDASGGFENLADHLADDYWLGESIRAAGWRLEIADALATVVPDIDGGAEHFRHMTRWARTIRLCQPAGHAGSVVLHGFSLLTLAALLVGPDPAVLGLLAAVWAAKAFAADALARASGARRDAAALLLIPLGEWSTFAAWIAAWGSSRVLWRGQLYDVGRQGRLLPVTSATPRRALAFEP
ncbi:MAG: glycosyltransferase [Elusimicrobia bacterium]|nr:glycosyltransferase [Elusimicrobiota bacterium]